MLYTIIITLIVIISVLLTIVVLLQPGEGQGLSGGLAGGMGFAGGGGLGARRAADLLSRSTAILAGALLVLSVLANFTYDRGESTQSVIQQNGVGQPVQNDLNNQSQTPSAVPQIPQNQSNTAGDAGSGTNTDNSSESGSESSGN